ncbi:hypothetical protein ACLBUT_31225, partial [Pseudomonas aeruginosa]
MSDAATRAEETSEGHSSSAIGLMVGGRIRTTAASTSTASPTRG